MARSRTDSDSDTASTARSKAGRSKPSKPTAVKKSASNAAAKRAGKTASKAAAAKPSARKSALASSARGKASKAAAAKRTGGGTNTSRGTRADETPSALPSIEPPAGRAKPRTAAQRDAAFDTLVRNACLKAGTAAAISSLTRRVPLLGRLAPTLLGPLAETVALAQVQKALVAGVIELYEVELSDPEQRGVVLLATATNIGAQQLSKRSMEAILKQFGDGLVRGIASRVLPVASILAEITAAVASTYTVGKRAQALCKLPGTGAGNLAELLRGLSGIDQARLLSWSGEAFRLALMPFKSVLGLLWR